MTDTQHEKTLLESMTPAALRALSDSFKRSAEEFFKANPPKPKARINHVEVYAKLNRPAPAPQVAAPKPKPKSLAAVVNAFWRGERERDGGTAEPEGAPLIPTSSRGGR